MLESFLSSFKSTGTQPGQTWRDRARFEPDLVLTVDLIGGNTYDDGLYRVCTPALVELYTARVEEYFPGLRGKTQVFAFDWLGRLFALDQRRPAQRGSEILLIEPGAGEAMEIPTGILEFHEFELPANADDALAKTFYKEWRTHDSTPLAFTDCVGYCVPLFLGGKDSLENLERIDMDVYIATCSQLRQKTRKMKPGQTIRSVSIG